MPIGRSDRIIVDREFVAKTVSDVFLKYRAEIIEDLRQGLIAADKDQPGDLLQSIDAKVSVSTNQVSFELEMLDYWKFVDEGVDGTELKHGSKYKYRKNSKTIPIDAMRKFIAARGISPKKIKTSTKKISKKSKKNALNSLAFAIGVNLKKHGMIPTHFFTNVVNDDLKERLTKDLSLALKKDIILDFKTTFE